MASGRTGAGLKRGWEPAPALVAERLARMQGAQRQAATEKAAAMRRLVEDASGMSLDELRRAIPTRYWTVALGHLGGYDDATIARSLGYATASVVAASSQGGPGTRQVRGNLAGLDLEALRADPGRLDELPVEDLPALLERCAVEHDRVAAVERFAHARLARELPGLTRGTEGLLTARQAAGRLGVSPDYVRDHGEALGLAVPSTVWCATTPSPSTACAVSVGTTSHGIRLTDLLHFGYYSGMIRARMAKSDVKTSFYLPEHLLRAAKVRAASEEVSLRVVLLRAVERYLARPIGEEAER
jgi:hypothetical protein